MFKFVNAGAKEALAKVAKYAAAGGLLLLAVVLTLAEPNRAEAGITGKVTVVNKSGTTVTVSINGNSQTPVLRNGQSFTWEVKDDSEDVTALHADGDDGNAWDDVQPRNVNKEKWTLEPGGGTILDPP